MTTVTRDYLESKLVITKQHYHSHMAMPNMHVTDLRQGDSKVERPLKYDKYYRLPSMLSVAMYQDTKV